MLNPIRTIERRSTLNSRAALVAMMTMAALCMASPATADDGLRAADVRIVADRAVQDLLAQLAGPSDGAGIERTSEATGPLAELARRDPAVLVPQLLLFEARSSDAPRARAVVGRVLLQLNAPGEILVAAAAPQLDHADPAVRSAASQVLIHCEDRSPGRAPDFSGYRAAIEADVRAGRGPQRSLVRFMYDSDPGAALLAMVRGMQLRDPAEIKPILWAEHVVDDLLWRRRFGFLARAAVDPAAVDQLDALSRHAHWWVRLYASAMAHRHPELARPEMVKRLAADADALVREALAGR